MNKFLTFGFEIKKAEESGIIEGYASTFKNIDQGFDMIMPGAFKKTIRESKGKFPILASHDPTQQIGFNLEAHEDETGLYVKGQLDVANNQKAQEHFSLIKMALELKTNAGLSIGYYPTKFDFDEDKEKGRYRRLKELKLFEYSPVAFPMNMEARATSVKQFERWLKTLDGDENALVENFVARMSEEGFNEVQIKSALERAAASMTKPDDDLNIHSVCEELSKLKFD